MSFKVVSECVSFISGSILFLFSVSICAILIKEHVEHLCDIILNLDQ